MNYLALCKRAHLLLRIGDETPGTQPAAVTGQTGVLQEIVSWIAAAHEDICLSKTTWAFMRGTATWTLANGSRTILKAAQLGVTADLDKPVPFVDDNGAFVGLVANGVAGAAEMPCQYVPYADWPGNFDVPPIGTGTPNYVTIRPDGALEFDAIADRAYDIRTPYRKAVVPLAADADEPMFDRDYHNAIVWWGIRHYYCLTRDGSAELLQKAEIELRREMTKLWNEQLPSITAC